MTQEFDGSLARAKGVAEVFVCVGCGYNLEQTDPLGNCPECGKLVSESKESVSRADRGWVLGMIQGLTWLAWLYVTAIVGTAVFVCGWVVFVALVVGATIKSGGKTPPDMSMLKPVVALVTGLNFCMMVAYLVVLERLTRREPGEDLVPRPAERWRNLGRIVVPITAVMMTIALPFQIYTILTQDYNPKTPPPISPWAIAGLVVGMLIFGVFIRVTTVIPADFASRVGSARLHKQARRVVMYGAVCWWSWVAMTPLSLIGPIAQNPKAQMIGGCASCPFLVGFVVAGVLLTVEGMLNAFGVAKAAKGQLERLK